jgi:hypothetical protein
MIGLWFKVLSSINERNIIIQARSVSLEVEMNLMEDLTKEVRNIRDEWLQLKLHLKQKYEHYPTFTCHRKEGLKREMSHDEIPSETNAYDDRKQQLTNSSK